MATATLPSCCCPLPARPSLLGRAPGPPPPSLACSHAFPASHVRHRQDRRCSVAARSQPSTTDGATDGAARVSDAEEAVAAAAEEKAAFPPGACQACGKADKVGGCNGEGRIQGGLGAVPGFGWWPIKAYRPCPAFVEAGGRYRRQGQSLEEVAFGRKGWADDTDISDRLKGR